MTSDRKHPSAAFWATVALVAVLVLYPLSYGPALWIATKSGRRNWVNIHSGIYSPIGSVLDNSPGWAVELYFRYSTWWDPVSPQAGL